MMPMRDRAMPTCLSKEAPASGPGRMVSLRRGRVSLRGASRLQRRLPRFLTGPAKAWPKRSNPSISDMDIGASGGTRLLHPAPIPNANLVLWGSRDFAAIGECLPRTRANRTWRFDSLDHRRRGPEADCHAELDAAPRSRAGGAD